jgi:Protein of unknown function (DUF3631)
LPTWAAAIDDLPEVEIPQVLKYQPGRVFDNWEPLLQIAELAGGRWPGLIRVAIDAAVNSERTPPPVERVLRSIKKAFEEASAESKKRGEKEVDRLTTTHLLSLMLGDAEEEWSTENRGRAINAYWLRGALRNLLDPPGAKDWWDPEGQPRALQKKESGYYKYQFKRAWEVYLADADSSTESSRDDANAEETHRGHTASGTSAPSEPSSTDGGNAGVSEGEFCTSYDSSESIGYSTDGTDGEHCTRSVSDGLVGDSFDHEKVEENQRPVPDGGDEPDVPDPLRPTHIYIASLQP